MTKKKKTVVNLQRQRHELLKGAGIIGGHLKKNENYSSAEKKKLYRLAKEFGKMAERQKKPAKHIRGKVLTATTITVNNNKQKRELRAAGYSVYKNKAMIQHDVKDTIKLRKNINALYSKDGSRVDVIERSRKVGNKTRVKQEILTDGLKMIDFINSDPQPKMPRGILLTAKIGSNSPFANSFPTPKDMKNYMAGFSAKDQSKNGKKLSKKELKEETKLLVSQMSVVFVK